MQRHTDNHRSPRAPGLRSACVCVRACATCGGACHRPVVRAGFTADTQPPPAGVHRPPFPLCGSEPREEDVEFRYGEPGELAVFSVDRTARGCEWGGGVACVAERGAHVGRGARARARAASRESRVGTWDRATEGTRSWRGAMPVAPHGRRPRSCNRLHRVHHMHRDRWTQCLASRSRAYTYALLYTLLHHLN